MCGEWWESVGWGRQKGNRKHSDEDICSEDSPVCKWCGQWGVGCEESKDWGRGRWVDVISLTHLEHPDKQQHIKNVEGCGVWPQGDHLKRSCIIQAWEKTAWQRRWLQWRDGKKVFTKEEMGCMDKVESRMTSRLLTLNNKWIMVQDNQRLEEEIVERSCLTSVNSVSILSEFSFSLSSLIQFHMSELQWLMEERRLSISVSEELTYSCMSLAKQDGGNHDTPWLMTGSVCKQSREQDPAQKPGERYNVEPGKGCVFSAKHRTVNWSECHGKAFQSKKDKHWNQTVVSSAQVRSQRSSSGVDTQWLSWDNTSKQGADVSLCWEELVKTPSKKNWRSSSQVLMVIWMMSAYNRWCLAEDISDLI